MKVGKVVCREKRGLRREENIYKKQTVKKKGSKEGRKKEIHM
jgi:hypothetical protein